MSNRLFAPAIAGLAVLLLAGCSSGTDPATAQPGEDGSNHSTGWRLSAKGGLNSFFDCLQDADIGLISAHRGGPAPGLPENAIETFKATLARSPALIELDVATSSDGVLYLMHDDTLDRTTTGSGRADAAKWDHIKGLYLIDNDGQLTDAHPPRFSDALAYLKDRTITQVDFKRSTRFSDAIREIRRQRAMDRVILIAYSLAQARKLHSLAPDAMISLGITNVDDVSKASASGIPTNRLLAFTGTREPNPRLYAFLQSRHIEVIFGTLGGSSSIDRQIARTGGDDTYAELTTSGVDVIATDRPHAAYKAQSSAGVAVTHGACGVART